MKYLIVILTGLFLITSCSTLLTTNQNITASEVKNNIPQTLFSMQIIQDGKILAPKEGVVKIAKREFKIRFSLDKEKTIYANFSRSNRLYNLAQKTKSIESVLGFGGTGMAEEPGNPNKDVYLTDSGWHVWAIDDPRGIRFDYLEDLGKTVIGERTVQSMYDTETKRNIPLSEMEKLFMVYCDVKYVGGDRYEIKDLNTINIVFE